MSEKELTQEEKRAKYKAGEYAFPPPPVPHAGWGVDSWIRYIDKNGRWL